MAEKSAQNLLDSLDAARARSLDRLLGGLGIPLVGAVAARQLAARYGRLSAFAAADPEVEREELSALHGIGEKLAASVAAALEDERFIGVVQKLIAAGIDPAAPRAERDGPLAGSSFCITGKLSRPRTAVQEQIKAAGGEIHSAVKRGTSFLVIGAKVGQRKIDKARELGTEVIDEPALARLIEEGGDG
jgi:DNA ligase (NAD+)